MWNHYFSATYLIVSPRSTKLAVSAWSGVVRGLGKLGKGPKPA
jgi:hypothetical protein